MVRETLPAPTNPVVSLLRPCNNNYGSHYNSSPDTVVAEGKPNKGTASELRISIKTVEKHREHLMSKLDIHDTAGLTRYAIGAGIIENRVQLTTI
jgi:hypothetical protein